jgi:vacuolar-type H+-ATPase subunit I/STV1
MTTIHPCEPALQQLKDMQKSLFKAESTDENLRKLKAIEAQIGRHDKVAEEKKAEEKANKEAAEKLRLQAVERERRQEEDARADSERRSKWHNKGSKDRPADRK